MIEPTVLIAIIGAVAAVLGSWFTFLATRRSSDQARIKSLEERFDVLSVKHRLLWRYCQTLIVHINTSQGPPAPDWPSELNDLD